MPQQSGVTFSNPFLHRAVNVFDSLELALEPSPTTIPKTHFVEWFSGSVLDSIWTTSFPGGGPGNSISMSDEVNGGLSLITGTDANDQAEIFFNDIRHYEPTACVCIFITKRISVSSQISVGFDGSIATSITHHARLKNRTSDTNTFLETRDGTTPSETTTGLAIDTNFHSNKIECGSADVTLTVDGVLKVTKTTNRPSAKLMPSMLISNLLVGTSREMRIRYYEVFNT